LRPLQQQRVMLVDDGQPFTLPTQAA